MKLSSRKELLSESEFELQKIRKKIYEESKLKKVDYSKMGIWSPEYDWEKLRKKDPTLPKIDPRYWYKEGFFGTKKIPIDSFIFGDMQKWLYFSDDLGSYLKRSAMIKKGDKKFDEELRNIIYPKTIEKLPSSYLELIQLKRGFSSILSLLGKILAGF
jgi:hypothetical protein